jgi:hypothetical protein
MMRITIKRWPRTLLLASMYMMGILGVVASGGGGGSGSDGDDETFDSFPCGSGGVGDIRSIAPDVDGGGTDIYVGGLFLSYDDVASNYIIRLNSDGSRDNGFDIGSGFDAVVWSVAPAADGSGDVYVGGAFSTYKGVSANRIIRLHSDGSRDNGFDIGSGFSGREVTSIVPAADGSGDIYVGGQNLANYNGTGVNDLVRLNSAGSLDLNSSVTNIFAMAMAPLATSDIYYGGNSILGLGRLNSNGTVDAGFAIGSGVDGIVFTISLRSGISGDIYVGGFFTGIDGNAVNSLVRLNSTGSIDNGFDIGSGVNDGDVRSIVSADDGTGAIYIGGQFTEYKGNNENRIVRINSGGSKEVGFITGSGFDNAVSSLARAKDGTTDVYVGGHFVHYNGSERYGMVRLNSDGSLDNGFVIGNGFCF